METPTKNIHQCLSAIMFEVEEIKKGKTNAQQGFKYRGIDDIMNALHNLFALQGVVIRVNEIRSVERVERPTKSGGTMLYSINDYQFCFCAADGSFVTTWARGEASDSADKSSNKAVSVALKYCLLQMFLIPTEEMVKDEADAYTNELGNKKATPPKPAPVAKVQDEKVGIQVLSGALSLDDLKTRWSTLSTTLQALESVVAAKDVMKAKLSAPPRQEPA